MTSPSSFNHHTGDELAHSFMPTQQPLVYGPISYDNGPPYQNFQQQQLGGPAEYLEIDGQTMAVSDVFQEGPGPFKCNLCGKQYHRNCDLNRHYKSHERRFKCPEPECEYQTRGWPTEQELQRHHNDVHSSTPRTFACAFEHCNQKFKRESNCKQHMEKAHQWDYVRSRTVRASYKCRVAGCNECSSLEETQRRHSLSPLTPVTVQGASQFGADPILFPDHELVNHILSGHGDQAYTFVPAEGQDASKPYVPWQSQPSRQQDITDVLHKVQTTSGVFPVDPALLQAGPQSALSQLSQYNSPIAEQAQLCPGLMHSPSPQITGYPDPGWPSTPNYQRPHDGIQTAAPGQTTAAVGQSQASRQASAQPSLTSPTFKRKQPASEPDEDEDGDSAKRPRRGKRGSMPMENFTDECMPCPFHLADPEVFCRSNKEKYSPCHTDHKDISTIVRHLQRPAHKLVVKAKWISSFEAGDMEKDYIRAGLCRNCWRSFTDRTEFARHFTQSCPRVSRGKREKFHIIYNTFCRLDGEVDDDDVDPMEEPSGDSPVDADEGDDDDAEGEEDEEDVRHTVQVLTSRYEKLEQNFQGLAQWTKQLYLACEQAGIKVRGPAKGPSPSSSTQPQLKVRAVSTPSNLVGGMDSAPTDVDRDALMSEVHPAPPVLQVTTSSGNAPSSAALQHATQFTLTQRLAGDQSDSGYSGNGKGKGPAVAIPTTSVSTPASAPATSSSMSHPFANLGMVPFERSMSYQADGALPGLAEHGVSDSQGSLGDVDMNAYFNVENVNFSNEYSA